jgi:hypothetical protein
LYLIRKEAERVKAEEARQEEEERRRREEKERREQVSPISFQIVI